MKRWIRNEIVVMKENSSDFLKFPEGQAQLYDEIEIIRYNLNFKFCGNIIYKVNSKFHFMTQIFLAGKYFLAGMLIIL